MPKIDTLIEDIYSLLQTGEGERMLPFNFQQRDKKPTAFRMSAIGKPCARELWYLERAAKEDLEQFDGDTLLKFQYGHIIEEMILDLAVLAGHDVQYRQEPVTVQHIPGSCDAVIDGVLVDVKSAAPYSFDKFAAGLKPEDDKFGYIQQLNGYYHGLTSKGIELGPQAAFLAIHKVSGKLCLDFHTPQSAEDYNQWLSARIEAISGQEPPERGFEEKTQKNGNRIIGAPCTYCAFKHQCWPGLRTFSYANGPSYLTHVEKLPQVEEIT